MTKTMDGGSDKLSFDSKVEHLAWSIIESTSDCIFVTGSEGNVIYMNHAAENLLHITFTHAFGKPVQELLKLRPVSTRQGLNDSPASIMTNQKAPFDCNSLRGYWLLQDDADSPVVNVICSTLVAGSHDENKYLLSLRVLGELESLNYYHLQAKSKKSIIKSIEFQFLMNDAIRNCQRLKHENSLLCIELDEPTYGAQHNKPLSPQATEMMCNAVSQTFTYASGICSISRNRFAILLEDCPLPSSIPRAYTLVNALRTAHKASHLESTSFSCWVGIAPINWQSTSNCGDIINMALLACLEAKRTNKTIAIRVYRSARTANPQKATLKLRNSPRED